MPTFPTPGPTALRIRNGAGRVDVETAADLDETVIDLRALDDAGARAIEQAVVEQRSEGIVVEIPEGGRLFGRNPTVAVTARVPAGSTLVAWCGSADLAVGDGLGGLEARLGSGDARLGRVDGDVDVRTGSGDLVLDEATGRLALGTGSGDVRVGRTGTDTEVTSGSGDVTLGQAIGAVLAKTGSGDIAAAELDGQLDVKTGSGDTRVDRARDGAVRVRTASGDVDLGVAEGTAAWLDLNTLSGRVDQQLGERAAPTDDQPRLSITVTTVSGDVTIRRA